MKFTQFEILSSSTVTQNDKWKTGYSLMLMMLMDFQILGLQSLVTFVTLLY